MLGIEIKKKFKELHTSLIMKLQIPSYSYIYIFKKLFILYLQFLYKKYLDILKEKSFLRIIECTLLCAHQNWARSNNIKAHEL